MNLAIEDLQKGFMKDRLRVGASMADIDPMALDKSITFSSVGGNNSKELTNIFIPKHVLG